MKTKNIAGYEFELPRWWPSVRAVFPAPSKNNEWHVQQFVRHTYGDDVGTKATWRQALKVYAITCTRLNILPVFMAHCYMSGQRYADAAKMYGELYDLVDARVENAASIEENRELHDFAQGEEKDWHHCYIAYEAGRAYALLGDLEKAEMWFSRSTEFVQHRHSAISYYAKRSAELLKELKEQKQRA